MNYIEMTNTLEVEESTRASCNWIPARKRQNSNLTGKIPQVPSKWKVKDSLPKETSEIPPVEIHRKEEETEAFQTDFLISPGDIYPNRKVKLVDAEIPEETKSKFEEMCKKHLEAFSKNNKDIRRTTFIEMEIDTGDSLLVA